MSNKQKSAVIDKTAEVDVQDITGNTPVVEETPAEAEQKKEKEVKLVSKSNLQAYMESLVRTAANNKIPVAAMNKNIASAIGRSVAAAELEYFNSIQ